MKLLSFLKPLFQLTATQQKLYFGKRYKFISVLFSVFFQREVEGDGEGGCVNAEFFIACWYIHVI